MQKIILMLLMMILLGGCAEMNSKFDCPTKPGVSCASLDQVNAKVDRGEIGSSITELTDHTHVKDNSFSQTRLMKPVYIVSPSVRKPLRYGETVQHIWIAPFEDTSGNYHQESDIYTIAKPGHWINYPIKSINGDEE